jgi:hypothetical protein
VEKITPDKAVAALSKYRGTVLKTPLSEEDTKKLQEELHESAASAAVELFVMRRGRPAKAAAHDRVPRPMQEPAGTIRAFTALVRS